MKAVSRTKLGGTPQGIGGSPARTATAPGRPVRLGEDVGEKTRWLGWRRPGRIRVGNRCGQFQVRQDFTDDVGVVDRRDQAQATAAARAGQHVERKRPVHQRGPVAWWALAPGVARAGLALAGVRISGHRAAVADDL